MLPEIIDTAIHVASEVAVHIPDAAHANFVRKLITDGGENVNPYSAINYAQNVKENIEDGQLDVIVANSREVIDRIPTISEDTGGFMDSVFECCGSVLDLLG